jgi:hypothetical protein
MSGSATLLYGTVIWNFLLGSLYGGVEVHHELVAVDGDAHPVPAFAVEINH